MQVSQIKLTKLGEGTWSVYWLGNRVPSNSTTPEDPSFWVQFESDEIDEETRRPRTKALQLPAGFLPVLHVGRRWRNGRVQVNDNRYRQFVRQETFELNIEGPSPISPASTWVSKNDYTLGQGFHTPCALVEADKDLLAIAAVELGRFYWGTSSRMMQALVTGELNSPNKLVLPHDMAHSIVTGRRTDGGYQLILRRDLLLRDAWPISRLLLDPAARASAKNIYSVLLANTINQRMAGNSLGHQTTTAPLALFPFQGKTRLSVRGMWLNRRVDGKRVFFVLTIERCSHPFPTAELYVAREKPDATSSEATEFYPSGKVSVIDDTLDDEEDGVVELLDDTPTKQLKSRTVNLREQRFTWLKGKALHPVVAIKPEQGAMPYAVDLIKVSGVNTAQGTHSLTDTQRVKVQTGLPSAPPEIKITQPMEAVHRKHYAQFGLIVEAAAHLSSQVSPQSHSAGDGQSSVIDPFVRDWHVRLPREKSISKTAVQMPVCECPPRNAPDNWWRLGTPGKSPIRLCQWVELQTKSGYFYIFELEPDEKATRSSTATYILSMHDGRHATDATLLQYLNNLITSKSARQSDGMEAIGWRRRSVKHMPDSNKSNLGSRIMLAIARLSSSSTQ